ncbi:MAG TPA: CBS domain-containing protein [Gemmatimonadaceae bacterium]|nr:CBS domain-containing protein [Gemmatimonadaceae bacterium]
MHTEYTVDHLAHVLVRDAASRNVVSIPSSQRLGEVRSWLGSMGNDKGAASHQGFPILDEASLLVGVVTRRDLLDSAKPDDLQVAGLVKRRAAVAYEDNTLRDAADHMVLEGVGRLPVVRRDNPRMVVGMISRSDLLRAHAPRLEAAHEMKRSGIWRR